MVCGFRRRLTRDWERSGGGPCGRPVGWSWGLIQAFCDSPYLCQDRWEESLGELQSLFYQFKNETRDALPDAELIAAMARVFEAKGGSLTALAMTEPEALLRAAGEARHG